MRLMDMGIEPFLINAALVWCSCAAAGQKIM